ncbi:TPA: hypothetical protein L9Q09_003279 [Klebsiella pneumoniae]|nr:hypothetical protein [Klebsiella pneumoniae]
MGKKRNKNSNGSSKVLAVLVSLMLNVAGQSLEPSKPEMNFTGNHLFTLTVINGNVYTGNVTIAPPTATPQ